MNCQLHETRTTYHCLQGAVYAEAKLLLASVVTVPSNGFVFHYCVIEHSWCEITSTVPGHNNKPCGPIVIAMSKDNKVTVYDDHLFFPLIALSNAIKQIVLLLTTNSSNNSIQ